MSKRLSWKMLHLLYNLPPEIPGIRRSELSVLGITCYPDSVVSLEKAGAVDITGDLYTLSAPAREVMTCGVLGYSDADVDMLVDHPSAFVIMPYRELWSDRVYRELIEPALKDAGLLCIRGDEEPLMGALQAGIWKGLLRTGVAIVDVSVLNANVFYELGMAHALGRRTYILKQRDKQVPADIRGQLVMDYDLADLASARDSLRDSLRQWAAEDRAKDAGRLNQR